MKYTNCLPDSKLVPPKKKSDNRRKIRVFAVDDEPVLTELIKIHLEQTGDFEVHTSHNSAVAIDEALKMNPDFICLDICMPHFDGGDILALLKEHPALKDIPVLILSSLILPSEVSQKGFIVNGEQAMMPKPVNINNLISYIKESVQLFN